MGSIPRSLLKAHQYRLLNEPAHAESICRDILIAEPENQQALDILLLSLTDQFSHRLSERFAEAMSLRMRLFDSYRRAYLEGLVLERHALAIFRRDGQRAGPVVYEGLMDAMAAYARALELSPLGNDDAILRWNTCVRMIQRYPALTRRPLAAV